MWNSGWFWYCKNVTPLDVIDSFDPDVFLGQSYNLTSGLLKCIYERPHLKIGLRAGDWGSYQYTPEDRVLYCSQQEVDILAKLKEQTGQPNFVHIHYPQDAVNQTHNKFREVGIEPISLMMCADTSDYEGAVVEDELKCDIGFVGGFWPYKGQVIEPYLFPLLHPVGK